MGPRHFCLILHVQGSWMEEWHQKLHNNTTPDDVVICEAYLAFLRSGGDNAAYWRVLNDNGITRERLEGYDRPITAEPEDLRWMRGALIGAGPLPLFHCHFGTVSISFLPRLV